MCAESFHLSVQDPVYTTTNGEWNEIPDPEWLVRLRQVVQYGQEQAALTPEGGGGGAANGEETATSLTYDPHQAGVGPLLCNNELSDPGHFIRIPLKVFNKRNF